MKSYYVTLKAYGDCLISFALLDKLPADADLVVLGTRLSTEVAQLFSFRRFPIRPLLGDVAAFFDLRHAGPLKALADLRRVRRGLHEQLRPGDRLMFEHADWRNAAIASAAAHVTWIAPRRGTSIYVDRLEMLRGAFGDLPSWSPCRRAERSAHKLMLHPGARQRFKRLPTVIVRGIVDFAARRGLEVSLLDPDGAHADLAGRVRHYLPRTSMEEAIDVLRGADLYVGADSFFLHVAYHLGKPLCAIVPPSNTYFAPPGLATAGGLLSFEQAATPGRLQRALEVVLPGA